MRVCVHVCVCVCVCVCVSHLPHHQPTHDEGVEDREGAVNRRRVKAGHGQEGNDIIILS